MEGEKNSLNIILDSIADGVFTVDKEWRITSFNRSAERITGFSRSEAIGQYCYEIFRTNVCLEQCALRETMETKQNIINKELNILDKYNQEIPVSISTAVLRDKRGKIIGGVETFRDLSLIKELDKEIHEKYSFQDIISKHPSIISIFRILPDIARSEATVLIQGKSGTGKELFAQAIHNLSPRRERPLVKVNCGALPETLLESELFGYRKGAFTDAKRDKPGRFQLAEGGTIFLDEIGDIPPGIQAKLLRVLEGKEFEPLGGTTTLKADVRIVTATNKDLSKLVKQNQFRDDLFYRLNVVKVELPSLSKRRTDIPLLIEHFIVKFNKKMGKEIKGVSEEVMNILMNYAYPGNIRELENIIEHAFILCKGTHILKGHLPRYLHELETAGPEKKSIQKLEEEHIIHTLHTCGGNLAKAAEELGIHRTTLWRKLKRIGVS
ncbi:MAG: sigma 54-interacting transcriptional regulator [Deltaproteobacteria bacterium]|nr:sigma 54-interacting transcriptional regulator [Deltaproteobacteria bacterium]